ncbi:conserved exported hypothetical protein [Parafrankia sp. Ea1.12]|nr:conserved exported hypothetical protein [Parafrankia sp. Ea1.12]
MAREGKPTMNRSIRRIRRIVLTVVAAASLGMLTTAAGCQPHEPCPYPPNHYNHRC